MNSPGMWRVAWLSIAGMALTGLIGFFVGQAQRSERLRAILDWSAIFTD